MTYDLEQIFVPDDYSPLPSSFFFILILPENKLAYDDYFV